MIESESVRKLFNMLNAKEQELFQINREKCIQELVASNEMIFTEMKNRSDDGSLPNGLAAVCGLTPYGVVVQFPIGESYRILQPLQALKFAYQITDTALTMIDNMVSPEKFMEALKRTIHEEADEAQEEESANTVDVNKNRSLN